jgi:hypothetical protein
VWGIESGTENRLSMITSVVTGDRVPLWRTKARARKYAWSRLETGLCIVKPGPRPRIPELQPRSLGLVRWLPKRAFPMTSGRLSAARHQPSAPVKVTVPQRISRPFSHLSPLTIVGPEVVRTTTGQSMIFTLQRVRRGVQASTTLCIHRS